MAAEACPICGKPKHERFAPFCSKRCADIDLGSWLKGGYVVPGSEQGPSSESPARDEDSEEDSES